MRKEELSATEFYQKINSGLTIRKNDFIILICAIVIASVGLNMDSTAVVIGAMLISPLMTPILAIGMGLSIFDHKLTIRAVKLLLLEVAVSVLTATIYFYLSPITNASNEIIARTNPTIWDVLIASAGGVAGIIGAQKRENNNVVAGVAIATALMPPICTVGYSLAHWNIPYLWGSLYLFTINCSFIVITTYIGIRIMGIPSKVKLNKVENIKINILVLIISIFILIPSCFSAFSLVQKSIQQNNISKFVADNFPESLVLKKQFTEKGQVLTVTVVGEDFATEKIKQLEQKLPSYNLNKTHLVVNQVSSLSEASHSDLENYFKSKQ